jgi:hypothetical protein
VGTTSLRYLAGNTIQLGETGFFSLRALPSMRATGASTMATAADLRRQRYRGYAQKRLVKKNAILQAHEFVKKLNLIQ